MGAMGKGLLYQAQHTPGIECVAVADIRLDRAIACAESLSQPYEVAQTPGALYDAITRGRLAICEHGDWVASCDLMDVFIEASSSIIAGAQFCLTALEHHKHLVMMNAEIDLIFGPYLAQQAHWQEVVYTSCDGDQHGVIKRLVDDLQLWGFNLVMAGNMKGFLDRYSNPTKIIPEADKRNLDYKMATAYTDGTKLCVEMALTANALGLHAERPGMAGPRVRHVKEVFEHFDFAMLYAQNGGVVDYVLGASRMAAYLRSAIAIIPISNPCSNTTRWVTDPSICSIAPTISVTSRPWNVW